MYGIVGPATKNALFQVDIWLVRGTKSSPRTAVRIGYRSALTWHSLRRYNGTKCLTQFCSAAAIRQSVCSTACTPLICGSWHTTHREHLTINTALCHSQPSALRDNSSSLNTSKRPRENLSFENSDSDQYHPAPLRRFCDSGGVDKCHDLLTYFNYTKRGNCERIAT